MEGQNYYCLTTRAFTLRCNHQDWLECTQQFYNRILLFYYNLFLDMAEKDESLAALNSQQLLRKLEVLTVEGRRKEPVAYPLPWRKVPLYFRRAAANAGIAAGRSCLSRKEQTMRSECFHEAVTYYKGTYRDFDQTHITLKVWDGEGWKWMRCRLSGNTLPGDGQPDSFELADHLSAGDKDNREENKIEILSPSVVLKKEGLFLHVPIRERVEKVSNAKTRMNESTNLCCVQFTNGDAIAVCAVLNRENSLASVRFLKGGSQYRHSCRMILEKLEKARTSTEGQGAHMANWKYWRKLQNISISYSHQASRQIVDFARQENCGIIILPKYNEEYHKIVMKASGKWSSLHLSNRIRSQLSYKAWQRGVLVLEVDAGSTGGKCAICAAPIRKNGGEFQCTNGHSGNRFVNSAVNLGRKCRESFVSRRLG